MVIVAHPDDADFMAAGTLAKWAKEGREIVYVLCARGDKGTSDPDIEPSDLALIREKEQQNAVSVIGGKKSCFSKISRWYVAKYAPIEKRFVQTD